MGPAGLLMSNRITVNDGFYADKLVNVWYGAYFMDPKDVYQAMDILRQNVIKRADSKTFKWNGPPELRFIQVTDDAVLNVVKPGLYGVIEFIAFTKNPDDEGWHEAFADVEEQWLKLGAKPHIAKFWGWEKAANGNIIPYQMAKACKIYTDGQKNEFKNYMKQVDPAESFASGYGAKLLEPCP